MAIKVSADVINPATDSIWSVLERRLGREPTNAECRDEIFRIMRGDPVAPVVGRRSFTNPPTSYDSSKR